MRGGRPGPGRPDPGSAGPAQVDTALGSGRLSREPWIQSAIGTPRVVELPAVFAARSRTRSLPASVAVAERVRVVEPRACRAQAPARSRRAPAPPRVADEPGHRGQLAVDDVWGRTRRRRGPARRCGIARPTDARDGHLASARWQGLEVVEIVRRGMRRPVEYAQFGVGGQFELGAAIAGHR